MKPFKSITKLLIFFPYYIFHCNIFFGLLFKIFYNKFNYKNIKININVEKIKLSQLSSFLFKTYELNDRILVERFISNKNKSIIIGAGLGFIASITFKKSQQKILLFEIDTAILENLEDNMKQNKINYELYNKNLIMTENLNHSNFFYSTNNFLENSIYTKKGKKVNFDNIHYSSIKSFENFNTIIIDAEGSEEYYIKNIDKFKNIKYLFFELHYDLISKENIRKIFKNLSSANFKQMGKCFNSFYFERK